MGSLNHVVANVIGFFVAAFLFFSIAVVCFANRHFGGLGLLFSVFVVVIIFLIFLIFQFAVNIYMPAQW